MEPGQESFLSRAEVNYLIHSDHPLLMELVKPVARVRFTLHELFNLPISAGCPIDCLGLSVRTLYALSRGPSRWPAPVTVADLMDLYWGGRLRDFAGVGRRRASEIEAALVVAGIEASHQS